MLLRYIFDLEKIISEIARVLKPRGDAIIVIGNSAIRGVFIRNSYAVKVLAEKAGLILVDEKTRPIPDSRRYLPPPASPKAGSELASRMREEVILEFRTGGPRL
jgi:ubiquinone/menaquinone biosynthesis C-methylase UbiE